MSVSITSFNPNTKIQSSQVNTNNTNLSQGITDTSYRAFAWGLSGGVTTGDEQGMKYIVPENVTAVKVWAKTGSGTATIRLQKDTTDIVTSMDLTSTVSSSTTFNATTITAGQVLTFDVTAVSSCIDIFLTLETQVTTII